MRSKLACEALNVSVTFALLDHADYAAPKQRNQYPHRNSPPPAVWESASDFVQVTKLQHFQGKTIVSHKLTEYRVRDDHFQVLFSTAELRLRHPHPIGPKGHLSRGAHAAETTVGICQSGSGAFRVLAP